MNFAPSSPGMANTELVLPLLKKTEILSCMPDMGIDLTKVELEDPAKHKKKVKQVFRQMLEYLCGISEEDIETVAAECLKSTAIDKADEFHENYSDQIFMDEVRKCMSICEIHDFGWKDLYYPTPRRFRAQLSGAIYLARFREAKVGFYEEVITDDSRTQALEAWEEATQEHQKLTEQLEEKSQRAERMYSEIDEIENECRELETEIASSNRSQKAVREENSALQKKFKEMAEELSNINFELQEAEAEHDRLLAKIVSSPDRRKRELLDTNASLDFERKEVKALEEKVKESRSSIVHVNQALKNFADAEQMVKEGLEASEKENMARAQLDETLAKKKLVEKKVGSVTSEKDEISATLKRLEEKLHRMRKQAKLKMTAAKESLEEAKQELREVERDHLEGLARIEAGEAEVKAIEARIEAERQKTNVEIQEMIAQYREVEESVLEENTELLNQLGVATED